MALFFVTQVVVCSGVTQRSAFLSCFGTSAVPDDQLGDRYLPSASLAVKNKGAEAAALKFSEKTSYGCAYQNRPRILTCSFYHFTQLSHLFS